MIYKINENIFEFIGQIIPRMDKKGAPIEYWPHLRYKNEKNLSLHEHGIGPFCNFKISSKFNGKTGVYLISIKEEVKYVGECLDLGTRFIDKL